MIDIDQEIGPKNCTHFMYARALNARDSKTICGKPRKYEIKQDMQIVLSAIQRLSLETGKEYLFTEPDYTNLVQCGIFLITLLEEYRNQRKILGVETVYNSDSLRYKIGDKVWYENSGVAIECEITAIDFCGLYYDLDEPIGHSVGEDELFTKEEIVHHLKDRRVSNRTLYDVRKSVVDSLVKGHKKTPLISQDIINSWHPEDQEYYQNYLEDLRTFGMSSYKDKKRYEEWFNVQDVCEGKV